MKPKDTHTAILKFKSRKFVHYLLIFCILLIQTVLVAYFYNEFTNKKNVVFIENQLKEINSLEKLADSSRKEFCKAQRYLQRYFAHSDDKYLDLYFKSLGNVKSNLESISKYQTKYPKIKNVLKSNNSDSLNAQKLKVLFDSTYNYSNREYFKSRDNHIFDIKKLKLNYNLDKYNFNIETKTYSDTVKKKGLLKRLGDAISGKETVRKESTVIMVNKGKVPDASSIKKEIDSIVHVVQNHYHNQIKNVHLNVVNNINKDDKYYTIFSDLLIYSDGVMDVYDSAIKDSKKNLEKELLNLNSNINKFRNYLVFGSMVLMFVVSILIMYLTRIAFIYEKSLKIANEQIKENLNFRNRILGMLSHELRSPLKIIDIFIRKINRKSNDAQVKEYLKSISYTNNTLLMQANQVLEYTKNHQVNSKLNPVIFNLREEIWSIFNSIQPYIETRNNKFIIEEDIDSEIEVYSDNTKMNQIFINILGNSNKFTENGTIKAKVKSSIISNSVVSLFVQFEDSGVGISKSDLEKIFEPYYQGVISESVENLGAGLGLSLCKEIVELFSGTISVDSELNVGTTVSFTINLNLNT